MSLSEVRSVVLPPSAKGQLYLSSMPGRYEPLQDFLSEAKLSGITRIACLAPKSEIEQKSPRYAEALQNDQIPWPVEHLPITDFGVPQSKDQFSDFVHRLANYLMSG